MKDRHYQETRVKLTNTQLNKLKPAVKNKTGTILKPNKKHFEDEELPHELFLTMRQTTKLRNAFANNMSTDTKLSKVQISKIIQSGGFFGSRFANLGKKHNKCCYSFSYNHGHNILRIFDVLPNFPFTTSETKPDY